MPRTHFVFQADGHDLFVVADAKGLRSEQNGEVIGFAGMHGEKHARRQRTSD